MEVHSLFAGFLSATEVAIPTVCRFLFTSFARLFMIHEVFSLLSFSSRSCGPAAPRLRGSSVYSSVPSGTQSQLGVTRVCSRDVIPVCILDGSCRACGFQRNPQVGRMRPSCRSLGTLPGLFKSRKRSSLAGADSQAESVLTYLILVSLLATAKHEAETSCHAASRPRAQSVAWSGCAVGQARHWSVVVVSCRFLGALSVRLSE